MVGAIHSMCLWKDQLLIDLGDWANSLPDQKRKLDAAIKTQGVVAKTKPKHKTKAAASWRRASLSNFPNLYVRVNFDNGEGRGTPKAGGRFSCGPLMLYLKNFGTRDSKSTGHRATRRTSVSIRRKR